VASVETLLGLLEEEVEWDFGTKDLPLAVAASST
jgi:hypothetical protein